MTCNSHYKWSRAVSIIVNQIGLRENQPCTLAVTTPHWDRVSALHASLVCRHDWVSMRLWKDWNTVMLGGTQRYLSTNLFLWTQICLVVSYFDKIFWWVENIVLSLMKKVWSFSSIKSLIKNEHSSPSTGLFLLSATRPFYYSTANRSTEEADGNLLYLAETGRFVFVLNAECEYLAQYWWFFLGFLLGLLMVLNKLLLRMFLYFLHVTHITISFFNSDALEYVQSYLHNVLKIFLECFGGFEHGG